MANPEHVKILKQGVKVWNAWRMSHSQTWPDLRHTRLIGAELGVVDFSGTDLTEVDLTEADLRNADLSNAVLSGADFSCAYLSLADFSNANLLNATFFGANLCGANLNGADLNSTNFTAADISEAKLISANLTNAFLFNANLSGAHLGCANLNDAFLDGTDFGNATMWSTVLVNVDLSQTKGLNSVHHIGPSSIGIDTLYKSKGQIPEVFLRGCGVPDSFIAQAKALIGAEEGIQFYSCFISYSGKDDEFARRLHSRLQQEHVRVWFAPHDMQSGKKLHEQIDEAIKVYDKLLILLSPDSILSNWVMTELRKARKAERKTGQRKLFPIGLTDHTALQEWECFDSDTGSDLATEVRQYFIPDFTNWKDHDAFEASFARLLKDLRASEQAK